VRALVDLFVPDGDYGFMGKGRTELTAFFERVLRRFYRSVHQIVGQVIDFDGSDTAHGTTYCRAEHEDGQSWIVMVMRYQDDYARLDGTWYFRAGDVQHWYASDILARPGQPQLQAWPGHEHHVPVLPGAFETWTPSWSRAPEGTVQRLTASP
jgi:hypothetical protein